MRAEAELRHNLEMKEQRNAKAQIDLGEQMVQKASANLALLQRKKPALTMPVSNSTEVVAAE